MDGDIRLNKYISQAGICSRRDADKYIQLGKVTINKRIAVMGDKVSLGDIVCVNGKQIHSKDEKVVLAFHKPIGVTCTEKDRFADKTIMQYIKSPIRVTYAGRLDKDSEGLIILTNDGDLIQRLMKGSNHHEKEYVVKVSKEITKEFLSEMSKGVFLKELNQTTRPCIVNETGKYTFKITLTQGLNRQIRRMCSELGYEVRSLKRLRVANIELGKLKRGEMRKIEGTELEELYKISYENKSK